MKLDVRVYLLVCFDGKVRQVD